MMFNIASMEAKKSTWPHIVFKFFKFKTSENLIDWEPMPDNANLK